MNPSPDSWLLCCGARALLKTKRQHPAKRRRSRCCAPLGLSSNLKACNRFILQIIAVAKMAQPVPLFANTSRNDSHCTETQKQDGFAVRPLNPALQGP